jgi:hypothetical protein
MDPQAASTHEPSKPEEAGGSQILVVDFGKPQSRKRVKQLRKGRGKLMIRVERIVSEILEGGTVKSTAQPIVIVLRESTQMPWPLK